MWKFKDIKRKGRKTVKNNFWTLAILAIFMILLTNEYTIAKYGIDSIRVIGERINKPVSSLFDLGYSIFDASNQSVNSNDPEEKSSQSEEIKNQDQETENVNDQITTRTSSYMLFGNLDSIIKQYNEDHNIYRGIFFSFFNFVARSVTQVQDIFNSTIDFIDHTHAKELFSILVGIEALIIQILLINPILVGENRVYLESMNYKDTKFRTVFFPYRKKRYGNLVKAMFLVKLYQLLWDFTIIGGIIKRYSYKMVPYILAENPEIKPKDAILMSRKMMDGYKLKTFKFDLSFIGWELLQLITLGIASIYVIPYRKSSYTEIYKELRQVYIEKDEYNYKDLNDFLLYEDNNIDRYPSKEEKKRQKEKKKIDYNIKYKPTSIILFFFIFSFIGWLWEVILFLVQTGKLINRGAFYGPVLPIYGSACTLILLLTYFKGFRKMLKNPALTFITITIICSVIEYFTSWFTETFMGVTYWDYNGIFMNLNGRICLENSLFFGIGGTVIIYFIAPLLERNISKISKKVKVTACILFSLLFVTDIIYSHFNPRQGLGITEEIVVETEKTNEQK